MTTREIERIHGTLSSAMSWSFLVMVLLGFGLVFVVLKMFGVVVSADESAFVSLLGALLLTAANYKALDKSEDELWREHQDASEREGKS